MSRSAESAQIARDASWNYALGAPAIAAGSVKEQAALERIDELRDMDMEGRMTHHPDFGDDSGGGFYRHTAPKSAEARRRRSASERYWRRRW
jgi:hypothetical protein